MTNQLGPLLGAGLSEMISGDMSAEMLHALEALQTGEPPRAAVKEHIGKGGKKFSYVDHVWVTSQLQAAFGQMWDFEVMNPQIHPDGSASCICRLTVHFVTKSGTVITSMVSEVGAWEDSSGKMPMAMRIASAASRGLCRCAFRRFGLGKGLYGSDVPEISLQECFIALRRLGEKAGFSREDIVEMLKSAGITPEDLVDRYLEAYQLVRRKVNEKTGSEQD